MKSRHTSLSDDGWELPRTTATRNRTRCARATVVCGVHGASERASRPLSLPRSRVTSRPRAPRATPPASSPRRAARRAQPGRSHRRRRHNVAHDNTLGEIYEAALLALSNQLRYLLRNLWTWESIFFFPLLYSKVIMLIRKKDKYLPTTNIIGNLPF